MQSEKAPRRNPMELFQLNANFETASNELFTPEITQQFLDLVQTLKGGRTPKFEVRVPVPETKEDRIKIHAFVREMLPFCESFTKNQSNQKKLAKEELKKQELIEKQGGQILEGQDHILIKISQANLKKVGQEIGIAKSGQVVKPFVRFTLMKRNCDTVNAGILISKFLNISQKHFQFAGSKDKRGVTTQYATLQGIKIEQLNELQQRKNWNQNLLITDCCYVDQGLRLGDLIGNRFTVVLRLTQQVNVKDNWEIIKNIESLKEQGFINYFGLQRFGTNFAFKTHEIGRKIIKQDWESATKMILKASIEGHLVDHFFATSDFDTLFNALSPKQRIEKMLIQSLLKHGINNYLTALQSLPRNSREIYGHAFQSFLWNKLASQRISLYGAQLVVGDLVGIGKENHIDEDDIEIEDLKKSEMQIILVTEENKNQYNLSQVVLPIFGDKVEIPPQSIANTLLQQRLIEEGVLIEDFIEAARTFYLEGDYRFMITVPEDVAYEVLNYCDKEGDILDAFGRSLQKEGTLTALKLSFNLRKSSYATMLMRELTKETSCLEHQMQLNQDYMKL